MLRQTYQHGNLRFCLPSRKWRNTIRQNKRSRKYLIEKYIPNIEVRIFIYEDLHDKFHTNDDYVTVLKEKCIGARRSPQQRFIEGDERQDSSLCC